MRKLRPIRGKMLQGVKLYTLGDLDEKRCGDPWWSEATKAFDWAREQVADYDDNVLSELSKDDRQNDEVLEAFADENELLFDVNGDMWERWW